MEISKNEANNMNSHINEDLFTNTIPKTRNKHQNIFCQNLLKNMFEPSAKESSNNPVDFTIFQYFKDLIHDENKKRTSAALDLLKKLSKIKNVDEHQQTLSYCLKRLIRGCGASTNDARAGFYIGLVGLLQVYSFKLPLDLVFQILEKELNVGNTLNNRADADAIVGKILVCGALIHSKRIETTSSEHIEYIINTLVLSTNFRTYHAALGFAFINEILDQVTDTQFSSAIWPCLRNQISQKWSKQTIHTIQCLIIVHKKFPLVINDAFFAENFGDVELLNKESYKHLYRIFWQHTYTDILVDPAFEQFAIYAASCKNLVEFWKLAVDQYLKQSPTKLGELITIKLLSDILIHLDVKKTQIRDLLTDYFMVIFLDGLKTSKQKKDDTLSAFYVELCDALYTCCKRVNDDAENTAVIKRLLLHPGTFNIEKYTSSRLIHQIINCLSEVGIKDIFQLFKNVFLGRIAKNPDKSAQWLNSERLNAGYMLQYLLQHKIIQKSYNWREEQLQFFLTYGFFYVDDNLKICKKNVESTFSKDFGEQCKNIFFTSLKAKMIDIREERTILMKLANFCNKYLDENHVKKCLRLKNINESVLNAWNRMYEALSQGSMNLKLQNIKNSSLQKQSKLKIILEILLINMGFQLFNDPVMAEPAINDLLKCLQRSSEQRKGIFEIQSKKHIIKDTIKIKDKELEWIEVVVDLFLHLLSTNSNSLRQTVNSIFPHVCEHLNFNAIHHILSMLNMKDGYNPLSTKSEQESEEDESDGSSSNMEIDSLVSDQESNEDVDTENDYETTDEETEDEIRNNDVLRNAVSQALMKTGGAVVSSANNDDIVSIDLNDITEEEGRKLDEALGNAFKAIRDIKGSTSAANKKSKKYNIQTITIMHFRIRVLDLIDIYLNTSSNFMVLNEIMVTLYDMLKYCVLDELTPLQTKVEKVLNKLTAVKGNNIEIDPDFKEDNLVNFIRLLIEAKVPSYEVIHKLRNKCVIFIINNSSKVCGREPPLQVIKLLEDYLDEFIITRNPRINISLIADIFQLRWGVVLDLCLFVIEKGIDVQTRVFRRIQVLDLLTIVYRNNELLMLNLEQTLEYLKKIEKIIMCYVKDIEMHSPKEFCTLLEFLINVKKVHEKLNSRSILCSEDNCNAIQAIRKRIKLENMHNYRRFCTVFNIKFLKSNDTKGSKGFIEYCNEGDDTITKNGILKTGKIPLRGKKRQKDEPNPVKILNHPNSKKPRKQKLLEFSSRD